MYEPEERSRTLSRILVPLGAVVVAVAIIAGLVFGLGLLDGDEGGAEPVAEASPTSVPSPTPPGANPAELAIGDYVRANLSADYVGDCSIAVVQTPSTIPTNVPGATGATGAPAPTSVPAGNAMCSQNRGERDGVSAYVLGQPLSEPTHWIFVRQNGGQFTVTSAFEITPEVSAVPGTPWPITPGAEVVVTGAAPCLNVREGPALNQAAVDCIADGTRIVVATGPVDADGHQWWQVDGRAGWVVADYLRYPEQ